MSEANAVIQATGQACSTTTLAAVPGVDAKATRLREFARWMVSFPAMLGALLVGRVFYEGRAFFVDPDLWWHIKVGQDILQARHVPTVDTYSFTVNGSPWMAYEWLGEIILGSVARMGGIRALDAFLIVLASMIMLAMYYLATLRSGNCKAGFVASLFLCSVAFCSFTMRPQMIGYLFLVLLLIVLELFRKGVSGPIWILPLLFLAWVNTHGSFIVGIGVLAVYLLCGLRSFQLGSIEAIAWSREQRVKLEVVLALSLAALAITPYGTQLAVYPFDMALNQPINVRNIVEWRSMPFDQTVGKFFLGFVVLGFILQMLFRFAWRLEEMVLLVGGTVMACLHVRFVLLFVPFFAPVIATMLARWIPAYKRAIDQYALNAALIAGVIASMIYFAPTRDYLQGQVRDSFPTDAVDYLGHHSVPSPMLNTYGFGGYLVGTGRKVFIDGRGDLYERGGVLSDYADLTQIKKPGALSVLDRYQIASCLLLRDEPLSVVLLASPNWKRIYVDKTSALFVRTAALNPAASK